MEIDDLSDKSTAVKTHKSHILCILSARHCIGHIHWPYRNCIYDKRSCGLLWLVWPLGGPHQYAVLPMLLFTQGSA